MYKRLKRIISIGIMLLSLVALSVPAKAAVDLNAVFSVESDGWEKWPQAPEVQGDTAVVIDADTGAVLYSKGMDAARFPASITKVMTALLVLENCDLNGQVTMTETGMADAYSGSSNCLPQLGEVFTVEQCLQMILIKSANDVATQMAEYIAGSVQNFADMMNARAAQLGCINTHFSNANGLENDEHYTCAYDMALIMREALKYDKFREIIAMLDVTIPSTNLSGARYYETHVQMIVPGNPCYYESCIGGKTGYTDISRCTLVTCAEKDGVSLITVIMGHPDWNVICLESSALYDYAFQNFYRVDMSNGYEMVSGGVAVLPVSATAEEVEATAEQTEEGVRLTYLYGGRTVGTGVMSIENYTQYQQTVSVTGEIEIPQPIEPEDVLVNVSSSDGEDIQKPVEKQGSGSKFVAYLAIGILGILILLCVILIFVGSLRRKRSRKRRKRRR